MYYVLCVCIFIKLFQKRLSESIVDTGTERNCGVQVLLLALYWVHNAALSLSLTILKVPLGSSIHY